MFGSSWSQRRLNFVALGFCLLAPTVHFAFSYMAFFVFEYSSRRLVGSIYSYFGWQSHIVGWMAFSNIAPFLLTALIMTPAAIWLLRRKSRSLSWLSPIAGCFLIVLLSWVVPVYRAGMATITVVIIWITQLVITFGMMLPFVFLSDRSQTDI